MPFADELQRTLEADETSGFRPFVGRIDEGEVAQDEYNRAMAEQSAGVVERARDVGPAAFRRECQHVPNDAQDVTLPFLGRNDMLDVIGEDEQTYAIVVANRR